MFFAHDGAQKGGGHDGTGSDPKVAVLVKYMTITGVRLT